MPVFRDTSYPCSLFSKQEIVLTGALYIEVVIITIFNSIFSAIQGPFHKTGLTQTSISQKYNFVLNDVI